MHPVEQAVYDAALATPVAVGNLRVIRGAAGESTAVDAVRQRLLSLALIRSTAEQKTYERRRLALTVSVAMAAIFLVVALPLAPSAWDSMLGMAIAFVALLFALYPSERTPSGATIVRGARRTHPLPKLGKRAAPLGPTRDLSLLLALHGATVLWDFDPALALALNLSHPTDKNTCGCGGCGG